MSRLNDLLRELRNREPALARDLEREVTALNDRRAFGLNFERHVPEAVELPGRPVRKGDKVRVLPPRGKAPKKTDEKLWRVVALDRAARNARLEAVVVDAEGGHQLVLAKVEAGPENITAAIDDLVVVAGFRDAIYPGLVSTGKLERGGDKPFHTVINAENYHALETLLFSHRGKVDCIYIDPPYNTGAKDWKYNNDYVEGDDLYRHSKWLAFMERRMLLAKELLNPEDSVLIVTIDEKEYLRLGLLLEQTFPDAKVVQMISSVINPKGATRPSAFGRTDEYIFFMMFGNASPTAVALGMEWKVVRDARAEKLRWAELLRAGTNARRADRPKLFYPVFLRQTEAGGAFDSVGSEHVGADPSSVVPPDGCVAVWPIRSDGSEGNWQVSPTALSELIARGYAKIGSWRGERTAISYLKRGEQEKVEDGTFPITDRRPDGSIVVDSSEYVPVFVPGTQWRIPSHEAGGPGGTGLLRSLIPGRRFPFPKSLYAVEDSLRFFVRNKPEALIVDFFSGSGTTAHAVMRLNRQDAGRRRSISVTNNEVSADEQAELGRKGLRAGDAEWERFGICEYITKPRIEAAIVGKTPDGEPIEGNYKFTDVFPMSDGFQENVEFFTLTYEAPLRVASNREFTKIAPLLWIRAGSRGRRIDDISNGWDVADVYGVLANIDHTEDFLKAVASKDYVRLAYVVTDEDRVFQSISQQLPVHVEPVRLYEAYLRNFEIESGRGVL